MATTWTRSKGGIVHPAGTEHRGRSQNKKSYLDLAKQAVVIRSLYSEESIRIHPNSGLSKILASADLGLKAILVNDRSIDIAIFWNILHLERISKALTPLKGHPQLRRYLLLLKNGSLDFLRRGQSKAKDYLFELEVWQKLNKSNSAHCEEPDIKVTLGNTDIGFACKKTYSIAGVPKVLSKAVKQIRLSDCEFGMVAFNIDELIPEVHVIKKPNYDQAADLLSNQCMGFLHQIERHLKKYFDKNKIIGALVSSSAIVDTPNQKPQFSNMQQWCIWTVPELEQKGLNAAHKVRDYLNCS